jgi:hypothetical protein
MTQRFFAIPACDPVAAEAELNQLLTASRVLIVERHCVASGEASFRAVCVRIASGPGPLPQALKADQAGARRVDYREVLSRNRTEGDRFHAAACNGLIWKPSAAARRLSAAIFRWRCCSS